MDIRLSDYGRRALIPSPVSRMMSAFAAAFRDGTDINLGVGYVNEKTIPDALIAEALEAIRTRPEYRQPFNYGSPAGSSTLAAAVKRFLLRNGIGGLRQADLDACRVLIGLSGATSLLNGFTDILAPGIVVTSDPMYYIYTNALERKGFTVLAIPEDEDGPRLDVLDAKLAALGARARDIAFFYFVTVNNPSCSVLSNARRRELVARVVRLCEEQGRHIPLVLDEAYELLLHDPEAEKPLSALPMDPLGIVYELGTLSKVLAPGMRIGYLLGRDGDLLRALVQHTSDSGFSAPLMNQEMAAYLLDTHVDAQIVRVNTGYREKAVAVRASIEQHLGPYISACSGGRAGFYFYITFKDIDVHSDSFYFRCLARSTGEPAIDGPADSPRPRVVYIPGDYCVHPAGDMVETGRGQLRLSYGYEDTPRVEEALGLMAEAAAIAQRRP